ncbi:hypothetical protein BH09PSE2_BH09PSE2_11900 [soil metagenome]
MSLHDEAPRGEAAWRGLTLATLAAGFALTLALNLPGQLSYDSVVQLADARDGRYHAWHPPMMAWLMRQGDRVIPGTGLYLTGVAAILFGALAAVTASASRVAWWAPLAALALVLQPQIVVWQGIVWKDVLFADALIGGFLLLSVAATPSRSRAARRALAIAACGLFVLCALVRQNGVIAQVFGAVALGGVAWRAGAKRTRAMSLAAAALVAMLLAGAGASRMLSTHLAPDVGPAGQLRLLQMYDLAGTLARAPTVDLAALPPPLAASLSGPALGRYTAERVDPFSLDPAVSDAVDNGAPGLETAWRGAVLAHPVAWLRHRAAVFGWMLSPPDLNRCAPVYTGVDGPPDLLARLKLRPHVRLQDMKLERYANAFYGTPLYSHLVWGAVDLALLIGFLRSRRPEALPLAALMAAALAYTLSFALIGVACDYRYLYALDLTGLAGLFQLCLGAGLKGRLRSGGLSTRRGGPPAATPLGSRP